MNNLENNWTTLEFTWTVVTISMVAIGTLWSLLSPRSRKALILIWSGLLSWIIVALATR